MGVLCPVCHLSNITMIPPTTFSKLKTSTCTLIHAPCKSLSPVLLPNNSQNRAKLALLYFMSMSMFGGNEKQIIDDERSTHHDEEVIAQKNNHNLLLTQFLSDSRIKFS